MNKRPKAQRIILLNHITIRSLFVSFALIMMPQNNERKKLGWQQKLQIWDRNQDYSSLIPGQKRMPLPAKTDQRYS